MSALLLTLAICANLGRGRARLPALRLHTTVACAVQGISAPIIARDDRVSYLEPMTCTALRRALPRLDTLLYPRLARVDSIHAWNHYVPELYGREPPERYFQFAFFLPDVCHQPAAVVFMDNPRLDVYWGDHFGDCELPPRGMRALIPNPELPRPPLVLQ